MPNTLFDHASNIILNNSTIVINDVPTLDKLYAAAANSAFHDAPARTEKSRCHEHTRVRILHQLELWAQGIGEIGASIGWLHGGAGAGKSAIMQSLAERCASQRLALGSFFFSRHDDTRNTAGVLIPTLIYQVARLLPPALGLIEPLIKEDPGLFNKSFQNQLDGVFIPVLRQLVNDGKISDEPRSPRIFLVDGLDECNNPNDQRAIINAAAAACHQHRLPVRFLIASRPDPEISASFSSYEDHNHVLYSIPLSEDPGADNDIRHFLTSEFLKIRTQHHLKHHLTPDWPHQYDINRLVWKASAHFIYASTVVGYVRSARDDPARSLEVVLGLEVSRTRTCSPFAELDALYCHIFEQAEHRNEVLRILGHLLYTPSYSGDVYLHNSAVISVMLGYSRKDIEIFMSDMASLIRVNADGSMGLLHASLGDYFCDSSRSGALNTAIVANMASQLERYFVLLNDDLLNWCPTWSDDPHLTWKMFAGRAHSVLLNCIIGGINASGGISSTPELLKKYNLEFVDRYLSRQDLPLLIRYFNSMCKIRAFIPDEQFRSELQFFVDKLQRDYPSNLSTVGYVTLYASLKQLLIPFLYSRHPSRPTDMLFFEDHVRMLGPGPPGLSKTMMDKSPPPYLQGEPVSLRCITHADIASLRNYKAYTSPKGLRKASELALECFIGMHKRPCSHSSCRSAVWCYDKITPHDVIPSPLNRRGDHSRSDLELAELQYTEWCPKLRDMIALLEILMTLIPGAGYSNKLLALSSSDIMARLLPHTSLFSEIVDGCSSATDASGRIAKYTARVTSPGYRWKVLAKWIRPWSSHKTVD